MMDWVKTSRLLESIDHVDSWIDKAGYTGLGGEFALKQEELNFGRITDGDVCTQK
jgi:hypothetical protein